MIRILSMDGGGVHAAVLAQALGNIYGADTSGQDIIRMFDYVVGTSGGSLIMLALCCGRTPGEIVEHYRKPAEVERTFSPLWYARFLPAGVRRFVPHESTTGKLAALKALFDMPLGDGRKPWEVPLTDWPRLLGRDVDLVIPAFDYDTTRATFFRSNPASAAASSSPARPVTLVDAVHASTTSPVFFFDAPAQVGGGRFWDGGLAGYNNPVLAGVIEAIANRPDEVGDMRVLSLGTCATAVPAVEPCEPPWTVAPDGSSFWAAIRKSAGAVLDDPPDAASFHAHMALRQRLPRTRDDVVADGNLVRLCPLLRPDWQTDRWQALPDVQDRRFAAMLAAPADGYDVDSLRTVLCTGDAWIGGKIPNQPIRMGEHLRCDIGHDTFAAGRAHWLRIST